MLIAKIWSALIIGVKKQMSCKEKIPRYVLLVALAGAFCGLWNSDVFADKIVSGEGANSQSGIEWHGCDIAKYYQNVQQCPTENGKFGGASWHIFKTTNPPKIESPTDNDYPTVFRDVIGSGYPGSKGTVEELCSNTKYQYYFAFVYDGWSGYRKWDDKSLVYYGPLDWGAYDQKGDDGKYHRPIYHNAKWNNNHSGSDKRDHTWSDIKTALRDGTNMSRWRVRGESPTDGYGRAEDTTYKSEAALKAWQEWSGDKNAPEIPKGTGFFCVVGESYEGRVELSGDASGSAPSDSGEFTQSSITRNIEVPNCENGCSVTFTHRLRSKDGSGSGTEYKITRTSSDPQVVTSGEIVPSSVSQGGTWTDTVNMQAGMSVCETLNFKPYPDDNKKVDVKLCAKATGSPKGVADLDMKVSKNDTNTYQDEVYVKPEDSVIFRGNYNPGAQSTYDSSNVPEKVRITYTTSLDGSGNNVNDSLLCPAGWTDVNTYNNLKNQFNACITPDWNNAFSMVIKGNNVDSTKHFTYNNGDTTAREEFSNTYLNDGQRKVSVKDVGNYIGGRSQTNIIGSSARYTPNSLNYTYDHELIVADFDTTNKKSTEARAYVPYNFVNETTAVLEDDQIVYAGESKAFSFDIKVNPRENIVTEGTYATIVHDAQWKFQIYTEGTNCDGDNLVGRANIAAGKCKETVPTKNADEILNETATIGDLNPNGEMDGITERRSIKINIPDVAAGTRICVRTAVYPSASGEENDEGYKNWSDKEGNHQWSKWSEKKCYTIAKKPTIQVWGGNVYSGSEINTSTFTKNNAKEYLLGNGLASYKPEAFADPHTFGSWGELGIISNGEVKGFGSGASMGYAMNIKKGILRSQLVPDPYPHRDYNDSDNSTFRSIIKNVFADTTGTIYDIINSFRSKVDKDYDPGGSNTDDFCLNSPLSFANDGCSGGTTGSIGNDTGTTSSMLDKQTIVDILAASTNEGSTATYEYSENDITIEDNDIKIEKLTESNGLNATFVVKRAKKNIIINGDILVDRSHTYTNLSETPKVILYAENDIYINCEVARIDAVLIADNVVKTCIKEYDGERATVPEDVNSSERAHQLTVNGAIIAKRLYADRTYGAGPGSTSIVSAEIINFDPTLYLFGGSATSNDNTTGRLETSYIHELAPRL